MQRSSTILAVYGNRSLTHARDCAVLLEIDKRTHQRKLFLVGRHARQALRTPHGRRYFLPHHFPQFGFVIEQFLLRGCPILKQVDNPFGFGRKVRNAGCQPIFVGPASAEQIGNQQRAQRHAAQPQTQPGQKPTPVKIKSVFRISFSMWLI